MQDKSNQVKGLPYFYDGQIRKLILQFMRCLSGFKVYTGIQQDGFPGYLNVPVVYGDPSRQAEHILRLNSENSVQSFPKIAVSVTDLRNAHLSPHRGTYPGLKREMVITERAYNAIAGTYTNQPGQKYQTELLVPLAMDISFEVNIWTTNTDHKLQIFEQIFEVFAPSTDVFTSSSPIDWTALHIIRLDENINFDNLGVPKNDNDNTTIMTLNFTCESWISPPVKIKRSELINEIILSLNIADSIIDGVPQNEINVGYKIITLDNHIIQVNANNTITLLGSNYQTTDNNGSLWNWNQLIDNYGEITINSSKIALNYGTNPTNGSSSTVFGYISYGTADNILNFSPISNSVPTTTLANVNAFINPLTQTPGTGLPAAATGQRYVLTEFYGGEGSAWPGLGAASISDIIQYNGATWSDVFEAHSTETTQYVYNESVGALYTLNTTDYVWSETIVKYYGPGYWTLYL